MMLVVSADRLANFIVFATNSEPQTGSSLAEVQSDGYNECGQYSGTPPGGQFVTVTCDSGSIGQYVFIYLPTSNYLTICEVEVYHTGKLY